MKRNGSVIAEIFLLIMLLGIIGGALLLLVQTHSIVHAKCGTVEGVLTSVQFIPEDSYHSGVVLQFEKTVVRLRIYYDTPFMVKIGMNTCVTYDDSLKITHIEIKD
jgi:hypothetical protein